MPEGYVEIEDIPAKLERLNTLEWNPDYKPSVMRMVYVFLPLDSYTHERLEHVMHAVGDHTGHAHDE